nr:23 kda phosphatidyl-ethanolamine-binding protein homolog [rats, sperm plasma membranes, Peptide Partial, 17 aa] [Rattus sp.]
VLTPTQVMNGPSSITAD